jgi:hypothetical protein
MNMLNVVSNDSINSMVESTPAARGQQSGADSKRSKLHFETALSSEMKEERLVAPKQNLPQDSQDSQHAVPEHSKSEMTSLAEQNQAVGDDPEPQLSTDESAESESDLDPRRLAGVVWSGINQFSDYRIGERGLKVSDGTNTDSDGEFSETARPGLLQSGPSPTGLTPDKDLRMQLAHRVAGTANVVAEAKGAAAGAVNAAAAGVDLPRTAELIAVPAGDESTLRMGGLAGEKADRGVMRHEDAGETQSMVPKDKASRVLPAESVLAADNRAKGSAAGEGVRVPDPLGRSSAADRMTKAAAVNALTEDLPRDEPAAGGRDLARPGQQQELASRLGRSDQAASRGSEDSPRVANVNPGHSNSSPAAANTGPVAPAPLGSGANDAGGFKQSGGDGAAMMAHKQKLVADKSKAKSEADFADAESTTSTSAAAKNVSSLARASSPVGQVMQRLIESIEVLAQQGRRNNISFSLDLEQGRQLKVRLRMVGDQVKSSFSTDSEVLRQAIRDNWQQLQRQLSGHGLTADTPDFGDLLNGGQMDDSGAQADQQDARQAHLDQRMLSSLTGNRATTASDSVVSKFKSTGSSDAHLVRYA